MNFKKILLFLLGFFVCHNIFWFYKGHSSTYLYIETLIAFFLFFLHPNSVGSKIQEVFNVIVPHFRYYLFITIICIIPSFFVFYGTRYSLTPFKGLASFFISFLLFFTVILYREARNIVTRGIFWGVFFNIVYSVLCFILYKMGIAWRIIQYFSVENEGFALYSNLYYRAQGFFMECSHCMCFFAALLPMFLQNLKSVYFRFITILVIVFLAGISFTGNITSIIMSFTLYFIVVERKQVSIKQMFSLVVVVAVVSFFILNSVSSFLSAENFGELLMESFMDIDVNDDDNISNVIRSTNIRNSLQLVLDNPLGVGYGCGAPLMDLSFKTDWAQTTNSFFTRVSLESGWLGFFFYVVSIIEVSMTLCRSHNLRHRAIGVSVIVLAFVQAVNGIAWMSFCLVIMAYANIGYTDELYSRKLPK